MQLCCKRHTARGRVLYNIIIYIYITLYYTCTTHRYIILLLYTCACENDARNSAQHLITDANAAATGSAGRGGEWMRLCPSVGRRGYTRATHGRPPAPNGRAPVGQSAQAPSKCNVSEFVCLFVFERVWFCACVCVFTLDNRRRVIRADGAPAAATHMQLHIAHIIITYTTCVMVQLPRYNIISTGEVEFYTIYEHSIIPVRCIRVVYL